MYQHFSEIASSYNEIRTTDVLPILYIKGQLEGKENIRAADIGCGGGRYDLLLFHHMPGIHLTCIDMSKAMVAETARYLRDHEIINFQTIQSDVSELKLRDGSMDCILTFNAIHHFDPVMFLEKSARVLRNDGYVFIYTRLQSQNAKGIWGRFFPKFTEKEDRLYNLADIEQWIDSIDSLRIASIEFFRYRRTATLDHLLNQAKSKHYSTFSLYTPKEFEEALESFKNSIESHFPDKNRIEWHDENVMIVFRKATQAVSTSDRILQDICQP